jgi:hypothetical protein
MMKVVAVRSASLEAEAVVVELGFSVREEVLGHRVVGTLSG